MKTEKNFRINLAGLGKRIYQHRVNKDLSPKQIASLLQLTPSAYRNIENGKSDPAYTKLLHIAEILEIDICDFISQK